MKRVFGAAVITVSILSTVNPLSAAERISTLQVENLFCASCPYIVKQILRDIPGVKRVDVSFEKKTAVVMFDDSKTNVAALTAATTSAGFPSRGIE